MLYLVLRSVDGHAHVLKANIMLLIHKQIGRAR
jgi:hypothetical protein